MDFKFSKDAGDLNQEPPSEKKKQGTLLVLLLILVGGFTYLYFFTGLIKPQETQKTAEAPAQAPDSIKMPLPPREGDTATPGGKAAGEPPKAAAPAVAAAPAEVTAKPALAAKPAPAPAKPKEEPKKVDTTKPADKKIAPVTVTDKKGEKPPVVIADENKPTVAVKQGTPSKEVIKKAGSVATAKQKTAAAAQKTASGPWSLVVGNYILEEALSADMGRVRKAGFTPIVKPSSRIKKSMNRLFVSDFNDRPSARSTLEKLKRYTSDGFIIEQGGKFTVYAGSYMQSESANSEKERLKAAGFLTTVKHSSIAVPSQNLSVGPFTSKKAADAALVKLKSAGIKAAAVQK